MSNVDGQHPGSANSTADSEKNLRVDSRQSPSVGSSDQVGTSLPPTKIPRKLGRYEIIRSLGQGGMGHVLLAKDLQLDRLVAMKIPRISGRKADKRLTRFHREAKAAASLSHSNLCPIHDVGRIDGVHFLTMAYVDGESLTALLKRGVRLSHWQSAGLIRRLALAMQAAHDAGVVHRDLKPSNIMIDKKGRPIIVDFGLASREEGVDVRVTHEGAAVGTPAFMSPEQIRHGMESAGPASDVYSLGVILYLLLAGRLPFRAPVPAIYVLIATEAPQAPRELDPKIAPELESICLKAVEKDPRDRFESMQQFADALSDYMQSGNRLAALSVPGEGEVADIACDSTHDDALDELATRADAANGDGEPAVGTTTGGRTLMVCSGMLSLLIIGGACVYSRYGRFVDGASSDARTSKNAGPVETVAATSNPWPEPPPSQRRIDVLVEPADAIVDVSPSRANVEGQGKHRRLVFNDGELKEPVVLRASHAGFESREISIDPGQADSAIAISLQPKTPPTKVAEDDSPPSPIRTEGEDAVSADAAPPKPPASAEEVLEKLGVERFTRTFSLTAETQVSEMLSALKPLHSQMAKLVRERDELAEKDKRRIAKIEELNNQWTKLEVPQERAKSRGDLPSYNRVVAERNKLMGAMRQLKTSDLPKELENASAKVVEVLGLVHDEVLKISQLIREMRANYDSLRSESDLVRALAELNQKNQESLPFEPTRVFEHNVRDFEKIKSSLQLADIPVRREKGVFLVDVRLNGSVTAPMQYDPTGDWTLVPSPLAGRLGLRPLRTTKTITLRLADGQTFTGHEMLLRSVRVGGFEREDVPCIVLPEELSGARPRLGGTFLRWYRHRLAGDRLVLVSHGESAEDQSR